MPNFSLIVPFNYPLAAKRTFVSVAMVKPHPMPHLHAFNNAHPDTWGPHSKFQCDWSSGLAAETTHMYIRTYIHTYYIRTHTGTHI